MRHAEVSEIVMDAIPGGHIDGAMMEAAKICVEEKRRVRLRHNSTEYVISIDDIVGAFSVIPDKRLSAKP